ncbi:MAG: dihydrodipicolinate synthase family protein [Dialister invisus]
MHFCRYHPYEQESGGLGADVLSIITPSFAVASQKELYDHYVEVAKHVDTPIVLYNIPARTGNKLLPQTVARLARRRRYYCRGKGFQRGLGEPESIYSSDSGS